MLSFVPCYIFDVDDTLVEYVNFDLYEWYEFIAAPVAEKYNIPFNFDTWKKMIQGEISRRYCERFGIPPELFWKDVDEKNLQYRKWMYRNNRLRLYRDVHSISKLQGKKVAWSVSSEACIKYVLELFEIAEYFDMIIGKDFENYKYIDYIKPNPKFIEIIRKKIKCKNCIVIGDSEKDMISASLGECIGILISRDGRTSKNANFIIHSLEELSDKNFL